MIKFQKLEPPPKIKSPKSNFFFIVHPTPVDIQIQAQNFFNGSQELLRQLPQHDKGPKVDSKGQIVKHTLVGSVQQFQQEKQRRQNQGKKQQVKLQTMHLDNNEAVHPNSSYSKLNEFFSSKELSKKSPGKVKSKDYQMLQLNEDEVQQEIVTAEKRVKINEKEREQQNDMIKKKLNAGDKLKMDAFARAMENYETTQENWEQTNLRVSSRVQRRPGHTMNEKIDQFRVKQEVRQLLEHIQPIEQKLGNDYWKQGLRSTESTIKKKYPYKYIDEIEQNPQAVIDHKPPIIEIIRKTHSSVKSFRPFSSFTSRYYLDKKLKENQEVVQKLIPPNIEQIDELQLTGNNILKQEINSVRNARDSFVKIASGTFKQYIKKIPLKQEQSLPDEILVQNYDKKTIINTGQFGSLKGYF